MTGRGASEALGLLHTTGSAYLFISSAFNFLVKSVHALLVFYITAGIVGLCAALLFNDRRTDDLTRFLSLAAVVGGVAATGLVSYIGLGLGGVVGPGWLIYLITAWKLWKLPKRRRKKVQKRGLKKRVRIKTITIILIMLMTLSLVGAPLLHVLGFTEWTVAVVYVVFVVVGTILFWQR